MTVAHVLSNAQTPNKSALAKPRHRMSYELNRHWTSQSRNILFRAEESMSIDNLVDTYTVTLVSPLALMIMTPCTLEFIHTLLLALTSQPSTRPLDTYKDEA